MSNKFSKTGPQQSTPKICIPTPELPPITDPYCPGSLFCQLNYQDNVFDPPLQFHAYLHLDYKIPCSRWDWIAHQSLGWQTMWYVLEMVNVAWPEITTVLFNAVGTATGTHVIHTWGARQPDQSHPWLWQSPDERVYKGGKRIDFSVLIGDIGDPYPN